MWLLKNYTLCDKCNERIYQELHDAFDFELSLKTGSAFSDSGVWRAAGNRPVQKVR
jgi:hypothetical protein